MLRRQADRSLLVSGLHSAAIAALELGADLVQCHNVLAKLEVIRKLIRTMEVGQKFDDVLLLVEEVLCELVTALLEHLLCSELDNLLTFLADILCGSLALARDRLALCMTLHGRRRRLSSWALKLVDTLHMVE